MILTDFIKLASEVETFTIEYRQKDGCHVEYEGIDKADILSGLVKGLPNSDNLEVKSFFSLVDQRYDSITYVKVWDYER